MKRHYDIAVLGAGPAGFAAALQCSRSGMKTLLIEAGGTPGGTMTLGGVSFPGLFHAWGKQVIDGIGWEMVSKCAKEANSALPDFSHYRGQSHWKHQIPLNPHLFACLLDEAFRLSGIYRFLKRFKGMERLDIDWMAPECGVRETAVIRGRETITAADYESGRIWPDSL